MKEWRGRNGDKPHRCPICHRVCTHGMRGFRLTLSCINCGVRWWYGRRV